MSSTEVDPKLEALLGFIKDERGFDFTGYKRPSLVRRITKRMQAIGVDEPNDYLVYLEAHPEEYAALFDTVYVSLWKCFNAASGAILAGPRSILADIHNVRRMFGGALWGAWPHAATCGTP